MGFSFLSNIFSIDSKDRWWDSQLSNRERINRSVAATSICFSGSQRDNYQACLTCAISRSVISGAGRFWGRGGLFVALSKGQRPNQLWARWPANLRITRSGGNDSDNDQGCFRQAIG